AVWGRVKEALARRELAIPNTKKTARATFLDGSEPKWQSDVAARVTLADWITTAENPYFSRAAANRLWAHFFGTGPVDPVDDMGAQNLPTHPHLLADLPRPLPKPHFNL